MADKKEVKVKFAKEKDTKNTVRFTEVLAEGEPPAIGTLYVPKYTLSKIGNPDTLVITLSNA